jgi:hypothetical protein
MASPDEFNETETAEPEAKLLANGTCVYHKLRFGRIGDAARQPRRARRFPALLTLGARLSGKTTQVVAAA